MQDRLRLEICLDDDSTDAAELFVSVDANGFSGAGSAWVNPQELTQLGSDLEGAFPLQKTLQITGGHWSNETLSKLEQEHLSISFYPVAGRGVVGCQVRIATPVVNGERPQTRHSVHAELLTSYQELRSFARALGELASGSVEEAVLHAVEV